MTEKGVNVAADADWLPFDPRKVYRFLYRERWIILGVAIGIAAAVIGWASRLPKLYEGVASLEYDPDPPRPLRHDVEDVDSHDSGYWSSQEWIHTQNQIIRSRVVAERVVRKLGLNQDPQFMHINSSEQSHWRGASAEDAALRLLEDLHVEQRPDTRIVYIRFAGPDPAKAQAIANTVADMYVEKTLQDRLGATVEAVSWLNGQLTGLKNELGDAELALHQFKQEHNIVSVSLRDTQNVVASKMQQFGQALNTARTHRIELAAHLAQLELAVQESPLHAHFEDLDSDSNITGLRRQIYEKNAERDALTVNYGDNHPSVRAVDAEIALLNQSLQAEVAGLVNGARRALAAAAQIETDLTRQVQEVQRAGLDLNLREIEYNRLQRAKDNDEKLYGVLLERATEANLTKFLRVSHVRVLDPALKPKHHVSPRMPLISVIAILGGIFMGFVVALIHDRLDRTVRSVEAAEALGVTVLGILPSIDDKGADRKVRASQGDRRGKPRRKIVPTSKDLVVHNSPRSAVAECCRSVRTNLTFMSTDEPIRSLVVTSAGPREGKTTVAISLAISLAQSGKRILLVDTDLRLPRLHRTFELNTTLGITSVLIGEASLQEAIQSTEIPNLSVLPCGPIPPNPAEIVQSARFKAVLKLAEEDFDCLILDSPPLGPVVDAAIIAPGASGALLVINARRTRKETIVTSLRQLRDVNARILGAVINDVDIFNHNSGYGSYYYYYYRQKTSGDDSQPPNSMTPAKVS